MDSQGTINPPPSARPCGNRHPAAKFSLVYRDSLLIHMRFQVEPQEKKKTPKGRAKKRITYTRRFVNVTMTGGKRKMNPNPTS
ncbi:hypothetical protein D6C93_00558 [Aureobasidium pullulans]|nr:hypothetical protein D6C93_00558 [Aureobasidium pullulans]